MRRTLTLIAATTALSAAVGVPAWSALHATGDTSGLPFAAVFELGQDTMPLVLASGDDDDDRDHRKRARGDDDDAYHDDDDDDDDDECAAGAGNPSPAGSVAPPKNGLFGNGAAPKVQVN